MRQLIGPAVAAVELVQALREPVPQAAGMAQLAPTCRATMEELTRVPAVAVVLAVAVPATRAATEEQE